MRVDAVAETCFHVHQYNTWSTIQLNKMRHGRHSVSKLVVHLVFTTKYRRKLLSQEHISHMKEVCSGLGEKMEFTLLELNGESDHVHLLIEYLPKLSISSIVNHLKGVSSRMLRKEF